MLDPEFWKKTEDSDYIDYTDTDSMFLHVPFVSKYEKGTDLHVADCLDASNKIGKDVNNLILEYNRDYYFPKCGKSMDYNMTNYKTEVVAEGILLLGIKKNYCLKQIAVKDKAVSKDKQFKYTGFPNIKADTPKLAKYLLDYLCEELAFGNKNLNKKTINNELNFIIKDVYDKTKQCCEDFNLRDICSSIKYSTKDYKDVPSHIMGMRLYNSLLDDKIFTFFSAGYKLPIKLNNQLLIEDFVKKNRFESQFMLNSIRLDKINYLGIPYDYKTENIKELFTTFQIEINFEKVWDIINGKIARNVIELLRTTYCV